MDGRRLDAILDKFERMAQRLSRADADFNEADHPRAEDGRFGDKAGAHSSEHKAAIKNYSGGGHKPINWALRGQREHTAETRQHVAVLDNLIDKSPLPAPTTLYRGISGMEAKRIVEMKPRPGAILHDPGFASTSTDVGVARRFAAQSAVGVVMEVRAPKGTKALDISKLSDAPSDEKETLLARDSHFKVVK